MNIRFNTLFLAGVMLLFGCARDFRTNATVPDAWVIGGLAYGDMGRSVHMKVDDLDIWIAVRAHDKESIHIWLSALSSKPATILPVDIVLKTDVRNQTPESVIWNRYGLMPDVDVSPIERLQLKPNKKAMIKLMYPSRVTEKFILEVGGIEVDGRPVHISRAHFRLENRSKN